MRAVFVHLSDIHFGQEKDGGTVAINNDAKERLIEDARAELEKLGVKASGLLVTGDIAYSGKKQEYQAAGEWLGRLADAVGCNRVSVQMLPGNHDIDRDKISPATKLVLDAIREGGDQTLDPMLDSKGDREMLYGRFEAYVDLALDYESELDLNGELSSGGRVDLAEGRSILFVRLNSALICSRKDDKGKLILGKRQHVLPVADGQEIVVLVHHPLSWFQDSDNARRYLRSRARMLISGHEHFPGLEIERVDGDRDLMLLAAGATNPDEVGGDFVYKYNILVFEWDDKTDGLAVTINPRTWDEEKTSFKRDDAFLEGKPERHVLTSPNFRKAPKPRAALAPYGPIAAEPKVEPVPAPVDAEPADAGTGGSDPTALNGDVDMATSRPTPTLDERLLQLRFFQKLAEGERLQALVELEAVPPQLKGRLDHAMERRLFRMLVKEGKAQAIEDRIAAVEANRGGDSR